MKRGEVSLMTQVIFAGLLVVLVLTFIWNSAIVPAMDSYENEHARLIAQSLSTAINALSDEEWGGVYREMGLAWDVKVFHDNGDAYISVSHFGADSGDILLINDAEDFESSNIASIYVIKEPGEKPRLVEGASFTGDMFGGPTGGN